MSKPGAPVPAPGFNPAPGRPLLTGLLLLALLLPGCAAPAAAEPSAPQATVAPPSPPVLAASSASAPPPAPPAPLACLPAQLSGAELHASKLEGTRLSVCLRGPGGDPETPPPCVAVDLATKKFSATPFSPEQLQKEREEEDKKPRTRSLKTTSTEVTACEGSSCRTLKPAGLKHPAGTGHGDESSDAVIADLSEDGKRVVLLRVEGVKTRPTTVDPPGTRVSVETYDLQSGKRQDRILVPPGTRDRMGLFSDHSDIWRVVWLDDDRVKLSAYRCCGPAGTQVILDLKKKTFSSLGDPELFVRAGNGVWLHGHQEAKGVELTLLHLASGKKTSLALPAQPIAEPEPHLLDAHPLGGTSWLLVHANPPGIAWLDVNRETLSDKLSLPLCP